MARYKVARAEARARYADKLKHDPKLYDSDREGRLGELQSLMNYSSSLGGAQIMRRTLVSRNKLYAETFTARQRLKERAIRNLQISARKQMEKAILLYQVQKISDGTLRNMLFGIVKRQGIAAAIVGAGGAHNLTENVMTAVNRQITLQVAYLDDFIGDLKERQKISRAEQARVLNFVNELYSVAETAFRQFMADVTPGGIQTLEERRVLGGSENCEDCRELAGHWEPFGELPVPGQDSSCSKNCQCYMEVRQVSSEGELVEVSSKSEALTNEDMSLFAYEPGIEDHE